VNDYADLGPDSPAVSGRDIRAIGWLEVGRPFPTGAVPVAFRAKLERDLARATPSLARVVYGCGLEEGSCSVDLSFGKRELYIPAGPLLYAAPPMIGHYVDVHRYRPPDEFIRAVETCPTVGSARYRLTMLRHARHPEVWPTVFSLPVAVLAMVAAAPFVRSYRLLRRRLRRHAAPFD
jgi:hypothetical protein